MTRTIQFRVLALVGMGVFAAGAGLSLLSRQSLLSLEESFQHEQERLARVLSSAVARDLVADEQILQGAANAPYVDISDNDDRAERRTLVPALRFSRFAAAICFASDRGIAIVCEPARQQLRFQQAPVVSQIASAIAAGRPVISDVLPLPDGDVVVLAIPLHPEAGAAQGAVAEMIELSDVRVLRALGVPAGSHAALLDGHGIPIAMTDRDVPDAASAVSAAIDGTRWTLRLRSVSEAAAVPIVAFRRTSLWLAPALAAIATLLAWGVAWSVRHPVAVLTKAAERIASGDLSKPIPATTTDEIGRLAVALEKMRAHLQRSIADIEAWNAELEARVESRTLQLRRVTQQVISAQEDERRRVARELHDETSQLVAAIAMGLDTAAASPQPPRERLRELHALVDRMHEGLHRLIVNLRPSVLDDLGLAAGIEWLAEHQLARIGVAARCELEDLQDVRLAPELEITVFRIVQEAIANIARHAGAESVLIQGSTGDGVLTIEIEDDGCGFDAKQASAGPGSLRGVGLLGMRERADLVGASLEIDSTPGQGTRVKLTVPVTVHAMEIPS